MHAPRGAVTVHVGRGARRDAERSQSAPFSRVVVSPFMASIMLRGKTPLQTRPTLDALSPLSPFREPTTTLSTTCSLDAVQMLGTWTRCLACVPQLHRRDEKTAAAINLQRMARGVVARRSRRQRESRLRATTHHEALAVMGIRRISNYFGSEEVSPRRRCSSTHCAKPARLVKPARRRTAQHLQTPTAPVACTSCCSCG